MAEPAEQDALIAEAINHGQYVRGAMPIHEQTATFENVFDKGLLRMGSLAVACLVLFLVLAFCTSVGWLTALVVAFVLAAAGGLLLRKQPTSDVTH